MSMERSWRIGVVGLGAIGTTLAALLIAAGHDVRLVARGARRAALLRDGVLTRQNDAIHRLPAQLVAQNELADCDLVIVAVKANALPDLLPKLIPHIGMARLMPAVNGLPWWYGLGAAHPQAQAPLRSIDPEQSLARVLPPGRILGCVLHSRCALDQHGVAMVHGQQDLRLGAIAPELPPPADAAAMFRAAGASVRLEADIRQAVWHKLVLNAATNLPSALTGATLAEMAEQPDLRMLTQLIADEMLTLAAKLGHDVGLRARELPAIAKLGGAHRTSMLQDVDAGRAPELGAIAEAPLELAARLGLAMPALSTTTALLRARLAVAEQRLIRPGVLSVVA